MAEGAWKQFYGILDPIERISEVLFGVIMTLTFTCTIAVATADNVKIRTILIAALGCNLAWGIIDAGVYLIARVHTQGRNIVMLRLARTMVDIPMARRIIADALPPLLASVISEEELERMRQQLQSMPDAPARPQLTKHDWLAALGVCLLCFLSTFPVAVPFMVIGDARTALRASNAVALSLLFCCGYAFGYRIGLSPWAWGLFMVIFGGLLVVVAIALGG